MIQTLQAKDITLGELQDRFNLQIATQAGFFEEWQDDLPELADYEQRQLLRIQRNYQNLSERQIVSEEAVKMVVLSPLLDLAEFYQAPFGLKTEAAIELVAEDDGTVVKGKIDVLVIKQQFWVLIIESKSTQFDVLSALPQALSYLLSAPNREKPSYGLLVNGREFVFIKLTHSSQNPIYARSFAFSIDRGNDLDQVLKILKIVQAHILS